MIYLTGDTHRDFTRLSKRHMRSRGLDLTADDYMIVCGDLGLCWAPDRRFTYDCDFFEERSYTVLWVQGNHENYDMIREFAVEEWHGGKVRHIVRDKVILLERGQVFHIEGKTFSPLEELLPMIFKAVSLTAMIRISRLKHIRPEKRTFPAEYSGNPGGRRNFRPKKRCGKGLRTWAE